MVMELIYLFLSFNVNLRYFLKIFMWLWIVKNFFLFKLFFNVMENWLFILFFDLSN